MNSDESLKDLLRKVNVDSFAERIVSIIHWLLMQSVRCKLQVRTFYSASSLCIHLTLQADASFADASWRRALKDTSSCTLRYVVHKPNATGALD